MRKTSKKWWFCLIVIVSIAAMLIIGGCSNEKHIYDNAQIKDILNGSRTDKIGEYSVVKANSDSVTIEVLEDWYFNYVEKNDYNFCIILYSDKNDSSGVFANKGVIQKDVKLEKDDFGDYMLGDSTDGVLYTPTDDKTLKSE